MKARAMGSSTLPMFAFQLVSLMLLRATTAAASAPPSPNVLLPHCQETCGGISIPYPFGIGDGCFKEGFEVTCEAVDGSATRRAFFGGVRVKDVSLLEGRARLLKNVSWECYNSTGGRVGYHSQLNLSGLPFKVSNRMNKLTTVGCNIVGYVGGINHNSYTAGCASFCYGEASIDSGSCYGTGCCQTSITAKLDFFRTSFSHFKTRSANLDYSPCAYAFVADQDWFYFNKSDLRDHSFREKYKDGVPLVLDWVAGNETCEEATKKSPSSYACRSTNSTCVNSGNGLGYICNCSTGFRGNPYLQHGCKDINECMHPDEYPCRNNCTNIPGDYICSCPTGHSSDDPKTKACVPDPESHQGFPASIKQVIGISIGLVLFLTCAFCMILEYQRRKLLKERNKFFQQNGGLRLFEEIRSQRVNTVKIYTKEDLNKATDNFNNNRKLGQGGHGTVYKGIVEDGRTVAIKRSKVLADDQSEEFISEMIILSQINHKNVVRLLGCCLEVEIPMLVYEFIPNGTLFNLIHADASRLVSLATRLRIAEESAEALAYLHSSASPPILHGDVKSLNILLDHNYVPKVSDFGASRLLSTDEAEFITLIQGTLGYLDPEFLLVRRLTTKSDVYSFGVVIVELITRKKAIYYDGSSQGKCLASSFVEAIKDDKLEEILDDQITGEERMDILHEVAELAKECLSVEGDKRPTMREVAEKLRIIRGLQQRSSKQQVPEECERLLGESSTLPTLYTTGYQIGFDVEVGR